MSVEFTEVNTSRSFSTSYTKGEGEYKFVVRVLGESYPEAALTAAVLAATPLFWYGLCRQEVKAEPLGGGLYSVSVPYLWEIPNTAMQDPTTGTEKPTGPSNDTDPLGAAWSLEIGGRVPKLFQSRSVGWSQSAGGGDAPDRKGLLNVQDGVVEGLELPDASTVLTFDVQLDSISMGYVKLLTAAVNKTNLSDWYGIDAGCALFAGATLSSGDNGRVKGSFKFFLKEHRTIAVGEIRNDAGKVIPTTPQDFRGWDYLEIDYGKEFDAGVGLTLLRPSAARIHTILLAVDFTTLGLGG